MKALFQEFKKFISRGNVIDLAVGIIIGSAFTAIVTALVQGVLMPILGYIINGVNFSDFKWILRPAAGDVAEVAILYGNLIQQTINFLVIALVVFALIKLLNIAKKEKPEESKAPPAPSEEVALLSEIRDLLQKEKN